MISLTPQVGRIHNLGNPSTYALITSDKILERVSRYKILKIFFSENLSWNKQANKVTSILLHITNIILQVHCTLKLQEEPRRIFSSVSLWKCWVCQHPQIFDKTTETGRKRCLSFALQKYMTEHKVISLSWLPVIERIGFQLAKMAHKSANGETWPKFL